MADWDNSSEVTAIKAGDNISITNVDGVAVISATFTPTPPTPVVATVLKGLIAKQPVNNITLGNLFTQLGLTLPVNGTFAKITLCAGGAGGSSYTTDNAAGAGGGSGSSIVFFTGIHSLDGITIGDGAAGQNEPTQGSSYLSYSNKGMTATVGAGRKPLTGVGDPTTSGGLGGVVTVTDNFTKNAALLQGSNGGGYSLVDNNVSTAPVTGAGGAGYGTGAGLTYNNFVTRNGADGAPHSGAGGGGGANKGEAGKGGSGFLIVEWRE